MAFVLDASIAIGWVVGRQASGYSRRLRLRVRREPYHAPSLGMPFACGDGPLRAALAWAGVRPA